MDQFYKWLLIAATLAASWWGMMTVHEAGHVAAAIATGGTVQEVELAPWAISRTDVSPNPSPLVVVWSGPVAGVMLPLIVWLVARKIMPTVAPLLRFFAGFCLLANGAYLAFGSLNHIGDAGDLLRHGAAAWQLWLFGIVCMPAGLWLWNGLGSSFGMGANVEPVDRRVAIAIGVFAAAMFVVLAIFG